MELNLQCETQKEIEKYSADDYCYGDSLNAEFIGSVSLVELKLRPLAISADKYKANKYDDDTISFMLTKKQAELLGNYLLTLSK